MRERRGGVKHGNRTRIAAVDARDDRPTVTIDLPRRREGRAATRMGSWTREVSTDTVTWMADLLRLFRRDPAPGAPSFAGHASLYTETSMTRLKKAVEQAVRFPAGDERMKESRLPSAEALRRRVDELVARSAHAAAPERATAVRELAQELAMRHAELEIQNGELQEARAGSDRLNAILRAIRNVNQLITKEDDRERLIGGACTCLTEEMSYHNAWIALLDPAGRKVTATAESGFDGSFAALRARLGDGGMTSCMRRALDTDAVVSVSNPRTECADCPLAATYGGWAGLSRRLESGGRIYGVLTVSVPLDFAGSAEEQSLFDEVAGDLGFALHKIEMADELRNHRIDLQRAQALAHVGSWRFDIVRGTVTASEESQRIYGLGEVEWTIGRIQTIPLPEYREMLDRALGGLIQRGEPYDVEFRILRPTDGAERIIHSVAEYDAAQQTVIGAIQDITEQRRAEEAERREQSLNRAIIESIPGTFYMLDEHGRYTRWNAYQRDVIVGKPEAEISGTAAIETIHPDDRALIGEKIRNVLESGVQETVEGRVLLRGGPESQWLLMTGRPMTIDGRPFLLGIGIDIDDRKKAGEALRQSEAKFATAFHTSPYAIAITRVQDGRFVEVNDAFTAMTGYSREEALGGTSVGLGLWVDPEDRMRILGDIAARRPVANREILFRHKDGGTICGLFSAQAVQFGGETGILSSINDITLQRRDREEREKLQQQLVQAQKMESVGRLAGGVAHDFNNMLGVIMGYAQMTMDRLEPDNPVNVYLREVIAAAKRSADVTRQLLAFARKQTIMPRVLQLNETVDGMLRMLRRLIGEDIDLAWKPAAEVWPVRIDPSQIDQVLANLCVNARDAIHGVGKVTIETGTATFDAAYCGNHAEAVPGDFVMLAVSDDGCGMDRQTVDKLFEPFFTTKEVGKGTGLGLATVYGIVRQNEGFINVYSEPGQGTCFKIYLPRYTGKIQPSDPAMESPAPPGRGETILLVEDEDAILKLSAMMLQALGYTVLAAASPGDAVRLAEANAGRIALLVTDVIMPEMNGRDLSRKVMEYCPQARVLYMSGYTANVIAHHGVLDEGVQFIEKPFSRADIAVKIRETLGGGAPAVP